jgi:hypothetical protein
MNVYPVGKLIPVVINTEKADGTPYTFSGSPALGIRKGIASAVTTGLGALSIDDGGITGSHTIEIDTTAGSGYYVAGETYYLVATAGTVDSVSMVGKAFFVFQLGPVGSDVQAWDGGSVPTPAEAGAAMTLTEAYDAAKSAAPVGAAMTLTGAYDAAKTAAQPGDIPDVSELALEASLAPLTNVTYGLSALKTLIDTIDSIIDTINGHIQADYTSTIAGRIDAAISSRAVAATALSSEVWTPTKAGYLDAAVSGAVAPTVEEINTKLETEHGAGSWGAQGAYTITPSTPLTDSETGLAISGMEIKVYSNALRTETYLITEVTSDTEGSFTAHVTAPGTYYLRAIKEGYTTLEWSEVAS